MFTKTLFPPFLLGLVFVQGACTPTKKNAPPPVAEATAKAPSPAAPPGSVQNGSAQNGTGGAPMQPPPSAGRHPVGPELVITPGSGMGAVFFGAFPETVERQMQAKCDFKSETRCAYWNQAAEFGFEDGVLVRMKAQRVERHPEGVQGAPTYGFFHGRLGEGILLGLHKHVVEEELGKPTSETAVNPPGPDGLVAKAEYPGLRFEYDRLENGNVILAAIEVIPSEKAKATIQKMKALKAEQKAAK